MIFRFLHSVHAAQALLILMLIVGISCGATPPPSESAEDAPDVSAPESGEPGAVEGWSVSGDGAFRWRRDPEGGRSGTLAMTLGPAAGASPSSVARLTSAPIPVHPGDGVEYGAWLYLQEGESGATAAPAVYVEALHEDRWEPLRPQAGRGVPQPGVWTLFGLTAIVPRGVSQVRLVAEADAATSGAHATWQIDDFEAKVHSLTEYVKTRQAAPRLKDILIFGADTVRQSEIGCYGSQTVHTPNIDLLAHEGVLFEHVMTASPWTRPSFGSIFTSLYPSQHTAELHHSALPETVATLADAMRQQDYFTVGFAITPPDGFLGPQSGMSRGFDLYFHTEDIDLLTQQFDEWLVLNGEALSSITGGGLFIFRHFFDPHDPFRNHFPEMIVNEGPMGDRFLFGHNLWELLYMQEPGRSDQRDIDYALAVYGAEHVYMDRIIGNILMRLRYFGLYDDLNIVFASDHGESFNEKEGVWYHGNPYMTCVEVPLILRFPGVTEAGVRVKDRLVSNLDIMPTLLALTNTPAPEQVEGLNLLELSALPEARYAAAEDRKNGSLTIRDLRYKLVAIPAALPTMPEGEDALAFWYTLQPGNVGIPPTREDYDGMRDWILLAPDSPTRYELYDLENDPLELTDISEQDPEQFRRMLNAMLRHCLYTGIFTFEELRQANPFGLDDEALAALEAVAAADAAHDAEFIELSPETIELLRSQGYF